MLRRSFFFVVVAARSGGRKTLLKQSAKVQPLSGKKNPFVRRAFKEFIVSAGVSSRGSVCSAVWTHPLSPFVCLPACSK